MFILALTGGELIGKKRKSAKPTVAHRSSRIGFVTVGQAARILGLSPSTLRLWENVGLIAPARSNGHFRLYSPQVLEVLKRIKYLREVKGLNVSGIKHELGNENLPAKGRKPSAASTKGWGDKLRKLREAGGLTVAEAAKRADISTGFLSAVELSRANPSVATLHRLAAVYGTTVLEWFDVSRQNGRLIRPDERKVVETDSGVRTELLSTGCKMLECQLYRVAPNAGSDGSYSHEGEEFLYVLSGTLEIWLDEMERFVLRQGDSFWFESNLGHRWSNPSTEETVLLWVNTAPTF